MITRAVEGASPKPHAHHSTTLGWAARLIPAVSNVPPSGTQPPSAARLPHRQPTTPRPHPAQPHRPTPPAAPDPTTPTGPVACPALTSGGASTAHQPIHAARRTRGYRTNSPPRPPTQPHTRHMPHACPELPPATHHPARPHTTTQAHHPGTDPVAPASTPPPGGTASPNQASTYHPPTLQETSPTTKHNIP